MNELDIHRTPSAVIFSHPKIVPSHELETIFQDNVLRDMQADADRIIRFPVAPFLRG